jgi:hypothetical protein
MSELWQRLDDALEKNDLKRAAELLEAARAFSDRAPEPATTLRFESFRDQLPLAASRTRRWPIALAAIAAASLPIFFLLPPDPAHEGWKGSAVCGPVRLRLAEWRDAEGAARLESLVVRPSTHLAARARVTSDCWISLAAIDPASKRVQLLSSPTWQEAGEVDLFTADGTGVFSLSTLGRHALVLVATPKPVELSPQDLEELIEEQREERPRASFDVIFLEVR